MGLPAKSTSPRSGRRSPDTVLRVVDFPAPFAPIKATTSPCFTSKEISQITWTSP
jgi:hypothetical protein